MTHTSRSFYVSKTVQIHRANELKSLTAAISTVLQLIYVLTLINAVTYVIWGLHIQSLYEAGDPKVLAGALSSILVTLLLAAIVGFVGVILARPVLREKGSCPQWFLKTTTILAWAWMVFIPVGTAIGLLLLRWRKTEPANEQIV